MLSFFCLSSVNSSDSGFVLRVQLIFMVNVGDFIKNFDSFLEFPFVRNQISINIYITDKYLNGNLPWGFFNEINPPKQKETGQHHQK